MSRLLSVFLALQLSVVSLHAESPDLRLLDRINTPPAATDGFWRSVSNTIVYTSFGTPLSLYAVGQIKKDDHLIHDAYATVGALAITSAATWLGKTTVQRTRPFDAFPQQIFKKGSGGGYSFPSGHTSSAFSTATSLSIAFKKWYVVAPAFTYASLVGYSRMYLGVHYPGDVLAGAAVGCASAYLSFYLQKKFIANHLR